MNSDWLKESEARRAQEQVEVDKQIAAVSELLASHGIKAVVVTYAGSGDEGCTEEVYCLAEPCEPDAACQSNQDEAMTAKLEAIRYPEDVPFVGDLLVELVPSGYENNEGGQGTIVLDTAAGVAKVRHGTFVTNVEYESYSIGKADK
jgi:hypothetical protein